MEFCAFVLCDSSSGTAMKPINNCFVSQIRGLSSMLVLRVITIAPQSVIHESWLRIIELYDDIIKSSENRGACPSVNVFLHYHISLLVFIHFYLINYGLVISFIGFIHFLVDYFYSRMANLPLIERCHISKSYPTTHQHTHAPYSSDRALSPLFELGSHSPSR